MIMVRNDDGTISNAIKWVMSLGVLGALVVFSLALIYLVRETNSGSNATTNQVLTAWVKCAEQLPTIAAQIRDDGRINADCMREYTDKAHTERLEIKAEIAELRQAITELVQTLKSNEQARKNQPSAPAIGAG